MGRELKRVPLDFNWELRKTWEGFINPHYAAKTCEHCDGSGLSPEAKRLNDQWYGYVEFHPSETGCEPLTVNTPAVRAFAERQIKRTPEFYGSGEWAIVREAQRLISMWNTQWVHHLDQDDVNALWDAGHLLDFNPNWRQTKNAELPPPNYKDVNDWSITGFGHGGLNNYICVKAKCERLGVPHLCPFCDGSGEIWSNQEEKDRYEKWERIEPPTGEGWQLWETVSEGSPVSPVFATSDQLVGWMVRDGYSQAGAEAFVKTGWAPSAMLSEYGVENGVDALGHLNSNE